MNTTTGLVLIYFLIGLLVDQIAFKDFKPEYHGANPTFVACVEIVGRVLLICITVPMLVVTSLIRLIKWLKKQ